MSRVRRGNSGEERWGGQDGGGREREGSEGRRKGGRGESTTLTFSLLSIICAKYCKVSSGDYGAAKINTCDQVCGCLLFCSFPVFTGVNVSPQVETLCANLYLHRHKIRLLQGRWCLYSICTFGSSRQELGEEKERDGSRMEG